MHLLLLDFDDHVELTENGVDNVITALVKLQKLLHIFQSMAELGFMDQAEFIVLMENQRNVLIDLVTILLHLTVCLVDQQLHLLCFLLLLSICFYQWDHLLIFI